MPGPQTTLLIEGTFKELVEEFADYVDNLKKIQGDSSSSLKSDVAPALDKYSQAEEANDDAALETSRDEVLKVIVGGSGILNTSPEKEFVAAYNLLIHLIHQSPNLNNYLQSVCRSLSTDLPASSPAKYGLALTILTTVFNTLEPENTIRLPVFSATLDVIAKSSNYESLRPQLAHLDGWLAQWRTPPPQQRRLYLRVAQLARDAGESEESYDYLIRALRTVPSADASSDEAAQLSLDALKTALASPSHFDFEDLTSLDSVQALRSSAPLFFELLEIFAADGLEDYNRFKEEHKGWVEEQGLDDAALVRKIRLLTLASLAASTGQVRSLPYSTIANDLQIPPEDVEMWVIDVIRAGLVEGKLSQSNKTFLIHRSTYRVFTQTQWREVAGRLDMWRSSLLGVLSVVQQEKASLIAQKEQELRAADAKLNGAGGGGGGGGGGGYRRAQRDNVDSGLD